MAVPRGGGAFVSRIWHVTYPAHLPGRRAGLSSDGETRPLDLHTRALRPTDRREPVPRLCRFEVPLADRFSWMPNAAHRQSSKPRWRSKRKIRSCDGRRVGQMRSHHASPMLSRGNPQARPRGSRQALFRSKRRAASCSTQGIPPFGGAGRAASTPISISTARAGFAPHPCAISSGGSSARLRAPRPAGSSGCRRA